METRTYLHVHIVLDISRFSLFIEDHAMFAEMVVVGMVALIGCPGEKKAPHETRRPFLSETKGRRKVSENLGQGGLESR